MAELTMPTLGAGMEHGVLVKWLVGPGDAVKRGDVVAEVETEKGIIEIEVFEAGIVGALLVDEGTRVPVGTPLAQIAAPEAAERAEAEPAKAERPPTTERPERTAVAGLTERAERTGVTQPAVAAPDASARAPSPAATPPPEPRQATPADADGTAAPHATPGARQLARERGVDLATVAGTGKHGVVTREDVALTGRRRLASPLARRLARERGVDLNSVEPGPDGVIHAAQVERAPIAPAVPPKEAVRGAVGVSTTNEGMRRAIAAAMSQSKREIPHYYLAHTIDLGPALSWLQAANQTRPVSERLLYGALLLKATAKALREVPELNARWTGDGASPIEPVHLGVAISLRGGGLIAPAIHDAANKSLDELMIAFKDLVRRARAGALRGSELADPTVTVTSLGERGVETVIGVINPPQVAMVGFGKVVERPWVVDHEVVVRPTVVATLAADHRVSDGHRGGLFLAAVERLLSAPEEL